MATTTLKKAEIEYPSSDGKPMAETDTHRVCMVTNIDRLERFFSGLKVYVSGNLLIYYVKGNPRKSVAPDTFVVKNCKPGKRDIFKIWTERRKPDFVLENTSKTTRREDTGEKKKTYAQIGVKEYFLYDPLGDWLKPPLQGFSLVRGSYERIEPDADGGVVSKELGIRFIVEDGALAMFDVATGERLLTKAEAEKQQAELEKQRAESAEHRAEAEKQRAESEKQRAEAEKQRADHAEGELRRLKEAMKRTNGHNRKNGN